MPRYSRCSGSSFRVEDEFGHADDAIHRRANLMAHVREELALRPIRGFRGFLRLR
jgi:hypothetical protein